MTRILDRISITGQFMLLFLMALALMGAGTGIALKRSYDLELAAKQAQIRSLTETGRSIAEFYVAQAQDGAMTTAQAQKQALAALSAVRFEGQNYFFVIGDDGTVLALVNKAWVGTNKINFTDPNGVFLYRSLISSATSDNPPFTDYEFPKKTGMPPEPKIALAMAVPEWGWVVGTGLYVDDIQAGIIASAEGLAEIFLPLLAVFLIIGLLIRRQLTGLLTGLAGAMRALATGALETTVPSATRGDEIGDMARAVQVFKEGAQMRVQLEAQAQAHQLQAAQEQQRHTAEREEVAAAQALVVEGLAHGLERLAAGDLLFRLNRRFDGQYEKLRSDFNAAMGKLQETIQGIAATTRGVSAGVTEITQASDDMARRTEQQAATLEETAAAMDEVTATVRKTAESANLARELVRTATADAELSGEVVRETVAAMGGIEESSKQISNIIGVIDEIAFQTNLLALNAGVEAARAGDAGRGFAVVATEVRALAQRSADAAKEIKKLISTSSQQVDTGVKRVSETGQALGRILAQVKQINGLVVEIAASAQEQASGLNEVNTAVNQMDQVTQQNAAMVEETTAASHALSNEAQALEQLVGQFQISPAEAAPRPSRIPVHAPRSMARLERV
jgi:methyl-accepting chemotaxis protein